MTNDSNADALSSASSLVEAEALAWIAQLNGDDVSEKDLAAFREWVNRSPACLLYTSPSPRDATLSRMPSSA